jgi:hypothetical protein
LNVNGADGVPGAPQLHGFGYDQLMWFSVSKLICHFDASGRVTDESE